MSSYKEIITGTINSVVDKVKDAAENSSVRDFYDKGTGRAKAYARIAKLTLEANGDNEELKKVFCEIGKLYYEQAKDAPEGYYAPLFAQAESISAEVEAKQAEIAALKDALDDGASDIEVEITEDLTDEQAEAVKAADVEAEIVNFENIVSAEEDENK